jgi:nitroreductase
MSEYLEVLNRRIAAQSFQPAFNISSQDLCSLIEDASLAPSSFNLQHCRFVAITTPELKSELAIITLPANRQKVMDASLWACVLIDRNDIPKHLFRIPDLDLSEDLCAELWPVHGSGSGHAARVPPGISKVSRMWSTARACSSPRGF